MFKDLQCSNLKLHRLNFAMLTLIPKVDNASVAKMASHAIFQYNSLVIDIDNTTLGLI